MLPLVECPAGRLKRVRGVLADIDDTLTSDGRLTADSYAAMEHVHNAGLAMIPITGRPAGWCDHIARMWPVDAVVGENGAFWFRYDHQRRQMHRYFECDAEQRRAQRDKLRSIADEVMRRVPRARVAADQLYREADLAIDYCEDVPRLTDEEVNTIVSVMSSKGLTVKVSSIHVNGWFGTYDKLTTTRKLLLECFGAQTRIQEEFCYIGDSPNDEPMFAYFDISFGVANVAEFASRMKDHPKYVTRASGGAGFAEFSAYLLRTRRSAHS